jgi:hypothetical protein
VEKEHLILPEHLSGEGKDVLSPLTCTGRIIYSFSTKVHRKDKMFLLHLGAPEG